MNHHDHVTLLRKGVTQPGGVWADLGAGDGAFTLALAELIGETGTIYAVDRDQGALRRLARAMQEQFPRVTLHTLVGDFDGALPLPPPATSLLYAVLFTAVMYAFAWALWKRRWFIKV